MLPECKIIFCKFRPLIEGKFAKICHVQNHAHYQTNPAKNYQRLVTFLPQWRISPSLVSLTRSYSFSLSLSLSPHETNTESNILSYSFWVAHTHLPHFDSLSPSQSLTHPGTLLRNWLKIYWRRNRSWCLSWKMGGGELWTREQAMRQKLKNNH